MKPAAIVADEMFPEGVGPYMEIEEVDMIGVVSQIFWVQWPEQT